MQPPGLEKTEPDKTKTPETENPVEKPVFPSNLIQYRANSINNPNNAVMTVNTSNGIISIPPKSSKSIVLGGDNTVVAQVNGISSTFPVKLNQKPKLTVQSINSG